MIDVLLTGIKLENPKYLRFKYLGFSKVSEMRFELTQPFGHYPLKVACLPIPPPGQSVHPWDARVERERKTGLEPATPTLARLCSTN